MSLLAVRGPILQSRVLFVGLLLSFSFSHALKAQSISVRETLGTSRAFLLIRDRAGKTIGRGEFTQSAHASEVSSTLSLHFRDGSIDEETSRFSQNRALKLISDHHMQRGPAFPKALDMQLDASGQVSITTREDGKEKTEHGHTDIAPSTVNGIIGAAITNLPHGTAEQKFDFIAPTGNGRVITLKVTPERIDKFTIANTTVSAQVYRVHYELGGVAGAVAPMIGKQPEDAFIWVTRGVPSLVREQAALYSGGPVLSLELAGATFSPTDADDAKSR